MVRLPAEVVPGKLHKADHRHGSLEQVDRAESKERTALLAGKRESRMSAEIDNDDSKNGRHTSLPGKQRGKADCHHERCLKEGSDTLLQHWVLAGRKRRTGKRKGSDEP